MIAANELRIGNWVEQDGRPKRVSLQDDDFWHTERFEPIPLTPELLEKIGFGDAEEVDFGGQITAGEANHIFMGTITYIKHGRQKVQYLHHLQNIYFALAGEELNISL